MAGLAFERAATLIVIDGRAAAMGADRGAVSIFPPHLAEHLVGCIFGQVAKIDERQGPRRRGPKKMLRLKRIPRK